MKLRRHYFILGALVLAALAIFLTINTYGNWAFAWQLRSKKIFGFLLAGVSIAFSSISFQTLTKSRFLTPSILGFDQFYVLLQTLLFFLIGGVEAVNFSRRPELFLIQILVGTVILVAFSAKFLARQNDLYLILMVGMILGTFFGSVSQFFQIMMDPNEFTLLQGKIFASFNNINTALLWWVTPLIVGCCVALVFLASQLDVLHLGVEKSQSLGIGVKKLRLIVLTLISLLVGCATAVAGPVTFLGFIVANLTYPLFGYKHRHLFFGGSLVAIFLLVAGQLLVEHVFHLNTTLSVVIEVTGGLYFLAALLKKRRQS